VISIADNQRNERTNADENIAFSVAVKSDMRDKNSTKSPNKCERSRMPNGSVIMPIRATLAVL